MSKRTLSLLTRMFRFRTRVAALAAGVGASAVLGVGVAAATGATEDKAPTETVAAKVPAQTKAPARPAEAKPKAPARKAPAKPPSWVSPVGHYTLSASFNQSGSMWNSTHSGQDFAVPSGTDVVAAHGGTVVKAGGYGAGDGPAYGKAVVIKHANGTYSQYAHLSRVEVRVGQVVGTGQRIALSGNTGNSSGPHLHFEIRMSPDYGSAVDPVAFLRSQGVSL
jgi:murein DD-endopeptidase MepM/ murein hydrolase activator NlpD